MNGMLAFLLFAGALHVDFGLLKNVRWPVGVLATIGVLISTALVGVDASGFAAQALGVGLPLAWALVFGALISPTDPVAVLSLLKSVRIPERLEMKIAGESLFNDGVGVVVFTVLLSIAVQGSELGSDRTPARSSWWRRWAASCSASSPASSPSAPCRRSTTIRPRSCCRSRW